ncbi:MAG TPA: hypothetical protein VHG88_03805 [Burkholderiales bacterium]|nr:hypothetical protein [Burkholderiales bacterium]
MRRFAALLLVAGLAACETAYKDGVPNERSTEFWVPVGSRFVLHRSLDIPPNQGSAYLQYGKLLPWYDVNQYAPYCALGLQGSAEAARRVAPDEFVVRRVSQRFLYTLAAAPGLTRASRDFQSDGMTYEVLATVMQVHSERQPEVRALTCANWILPQGRSSLTVEHIRRALGSYFSLELNLSGGPTAMSRSAKALRIARAKATAPG